MNDKIWAIVPYKGSMEAKTRLKHRLSRELRTDLVHAMLYDVLSVLSKAKSLDQVLLVSNSDYAQQLADQMGLVFYRENATDLVGALIEASTYISEKFNAKTCFIVPADVPMIAVDEVEAALEGHEEVTVIPDANQIGTNGLVCTPPNAFRYIFDGQSFLPHLHAARSANLKTRELKLSSFEIDIDNESDVVAFLAKNVRRKTFDVLSRDETLICAS